MYYIFLLNCIVVIYTQSFFTIYMGHSEKTTCATTVPGRVEQAVTQDGDEALAILQN